jgi:Phage integrase family
MQSRYRRAAALSLPYARHGGVPLGRHRLLRLINAALSRSLATRLLAAGLDDQRQRAWIGPRGDGAAASRQRERCRSGRCFASSTAPRGRPWSGAAVRSEFRRLAARAGVRRRFAPHHLRHAHALAREGVPLNVIQRQLGHANLGTTSVYLQGIDPEEIIMAVHARRAPMMSATAGLRLWTTATTRTSGSATRRSRFAQTERASACRPPAHARIVQLRRVTRDLRDARTCLPSWLTTS